MSSFSWANSTEIVDDFSFRLKYSRLGNLPNWLSAEGKKQAVLSWSIYHPQAAPDANLIQRSHFGVLVGSRMPLFNNVESAKESVTTFLDSASTTAFFELWDGNGSVTMQHKHWNVVASRCTIGGSRFPENRYTQSLKGLWYFRGALVPRKKRTAFIFVLPVAPCFADMSASSDRR